MCSRQDFEFPLQIGTRADVELRKPQEKKLLEGHRQAVLLTEIHHRQAPVRCKPGHAGLERLAPDRDHRHGIGINHPIVDIDAEGVRRRRISGIALAELNSVTQSRTFDIVPCGLKHVFGNIDPEKAGIRIALRRRDQIAAGAATQFQDGCALGQLEAFDQPVAPEKVIFPGQIVEMALVAVDRIHQPRRFRGCCRRFIRYRHTGGTRRRSTNDPAVRAAGFLLPRKSSDQAFRPQPGPGAASARPRCGRSPERPDVRSG